MAESVKPFREPLEEVTYSKIDKPSLKFDFVGSSTILPKGSTPNPLMAASCFTWSLLARVPPDSMMILTALLTSKLFQVFSAMLSVVSIHNSFDNRRFSSWVIKPFLKFSSIKKALSLASSMILGFSGIILLSVTATDKPETVAESKPKVFKSSISWAVSSGVHRLIAFLIKDLIVPAVTAWLMNF